MTTLNQRTAAMVERLIGEKDELRLEIAEGAGGVRLIDAGIRAAGGLEAGCRVAEITLAGLGRVRLVPAAGSQQTPCVQIHTDQPLLACMASQYAGWQIRGRGFFAMGSGPMRALAAVEPLYEKIGYRETADVAVGVLETRDAPPTETIDKIASSCGVRPERLTLILAPTASIVGTIQVVARTVETALHQLLELDFPLDRIVSGWGVAPMPPVAADDLTAIGHTNDAVLYGSEVTLWIRGAGLDWQATLAQVPSCESSDFGRPFLEIFESYERDFYKIDPRLFSPAVVSVIDLDSGKFRRFGRRNESVLARWLDAPAGRCGSDA